MATESLAPIEPGAKVIIIAGPNGAGKTTFALEYLPYEPVIRRRFDRSLKNLVENGEMVEIEPAPN